MDDPIADFVGNELMSLAKGALERALEPLVQKGDFTEAQKGVIVAATEIELQATFKEVAAARAQARPT